MPSSVPASFDETVTGNLSLSKGLGELAEVEVGHSPEDEIDPTIAQDERRSISVRRRAWEVERGLLFGSLPYDARMAHPWKEHNGLG